MSDIPVGTPPAPPGRHAAPSGWYPDPTDGGQERYWDGWQWSRNTRAREGAPAPQPTPPTGQPGQPYGGHPAAGAQPGHPQQQGYPQGQQQGYPQGQQPGYPPQGQQPGYPPQGYPQAAYGVPGQPPGPTTADGVRLAGWWWRVLATVVDNLILGVLSTLISLPVLLPLLDRFAAYVAEAMQAAEQGRVQPPLDPNTLVSVRDQVLLALLGVALSLVYQLVFLRWKRATPGQLICGLRVVPVDRGRAVEPLGWNSIVVRALFWALPGLSGLGGAFTALGLFRLVDVLFPLWHPRRQTLHDLAAKTQVVKP